MLFVYRTYPSMEEKSMLQFYDTAVLRQGSVLAGRLVYLLQEVEEAARAPRLRSARIITERSFLIR